VCSHVQAAGPDAELPLVRCYLGRGLDHLVVCEPCAEAFASGDEVPATPVCESCYREFGSSPERNVGSPVPLERPEPFDATVRTVAVGGLPADLVDAACAGTGAWYGLCADGTLVELDEWSLGRVVATGTVTDEEPVPGPPQPRPRLHVSPSGAYAAVVNDYARLGRIVRLDDGSEAMALDTGSDHAWTVPFPLAFVPAGERDLVVHATDWNRLDVSDPETGGLLTARGPTSKGAGEGGPEHYSDYFHGALHPSPDGRWLLDDGWVWHPSGVPSAWLVEPWLGGNPWEPEDGPSLRLLDNRDQWDVGMCWLDDRHAAIARVNEYDYTVVDGARVFDVTGETRFYAANGTRWCREVATFAGPVGAFFGDGSRLYSAGEDGLSVWDVATGERTGRIQGFRPSRQSRSRGELVEVRARELRVWRYAAG